MQGCGCRGAGAGRERSVATTLTPHGAKGHPAPTSPAALSHRFPLTVLGGAGMYWDPQGSHWDMLGPVAPVLGHAGIHSLSNGMCWNPQPQHWMLLGTQLLH